MSVLDWSMRDGLNWMRRALRVSRWKVRRPLPLVICTTCVKCKEQVTVRLFKGQAGIHPRRAMAFCPCGAWLAMVDEMPLEGDNDKERT
jgi:hypothetical protein